MRREGAARDRQGNVLFINFFLETSQCPRIEVAQTSPQKTSYFLLLQKETFSNISASVYAAMTSHDVMHVLYFNEARAHWLFEGNDVMFEIPGNAEKPPFGEFMNGNRTVTISCKGKHKFF